MRHEKLRGSNQQHDQTGKRKRSRGRSCGTRHVGFLSRLAGPQPNRHVAEESETADEPLASPRLRAPHHRGLELADGTPGPGCDTRGLVERLSHRGGRAAEHRTSLYGPDRAIPAKTSFAMPRAGGRIKPRSRLTKRPTTSTPNLMTSRANNSSGYSIAWQGPTRSRSARTNGRRSSSSRRPRT